MYHMYGEGMGHRNTLTHAIWTRAAGLGFARAWGEIPCLGAASSFVLRGGAEA